MKKAFYWTVALLSVIYSCTQKEMEIVTPEEPETELIELTVKASIGETDGTKTAIQSDGASIYWTQGDAINLFYGELSAGQFTSSITTPSQSTDFSGTLSVATGTTEAGMTARRFWGVYPYNAANSCDGSGVTLTIPEYQNGVAGTFADKLNPTVATSPGLDLAFYNVGSWFIFSVTQENVVSATFRGLASESLAGTVRVSMDANGRPASEVQSGITEIMMYPEDGGSFVVGEKYYMVVIPQTLSQGYSLTLQKSDGSTAECVVSGSKTFTRSQYRSKLNADNGLTYQNNTPLIINGHEYVDLGLSVKWATCNVGANLPWRYGDYYAWGETEPKSKYDWSTYKWCTGYYNTLTKYVTVYTYASNNRSDSKTKLADYGFADDAARVNWGGSWRIPTDEEWIELRTNCTWTWQMDYRLGVNGYIVTSNISGYTNNSIFLPAAGYQNDSNLSNEGTSGYYWASSIWTDYPPQAYSHVFDSSKVNGGTSNRFLGKSVRPVTE